MPYAKAPDQWGLLIDVAFDTALKALKRDGEMQPFCLLHRDDAQYMVPFSASGGDRDRFYLLVRSASVAVDARAAMMVMDAWMKAMTKRPDESEVAFVQRAGVVRPRDADDGREIVSVALTYRNYMSHGLTRVGQYAEINRDPKTGKVTSLAPREPMPSGTLGGDSFNLMIITRPMPDQQLVAREILAHFGVNMVPIQAGTRH